MNKTSIRGSLLLLLTATIWGAAFVAQSVGMDYVGPFTFNCIRNLIGSAVLVPCLLFLDKIRTKQMKADDPEREMFSWKQKELYIGGLGCGLALFAASSFQQFGIMYTTVGKAGFVTALYIVLVPILGIFLKRKTGLKIWFSVAMAVVGLYLLCMTEKLTLNKGDLLVLICAFLFAVQIMLVDHFAPRVDGVRLSCLQFLVTGVCSGVGMFLTEQPHLAAIFSAWLPILYAGILSCGVAYTLQIVAQKDLDPTIASLIMSLESVVSVLAGWVLLHQHLSAREIFGCVLMFGAIILAQLPQRKKKS